MPNLNVAGWWDQEDFYGPMKIYELLEKNDTKHNELCGGRAVESRRLGAIGTGRNWATSISAATPAQYFREKIQAPWFAYWLKDKGSTC